MVLHRSQDGFTGRPDDPTAPPWSPRLFLCVVATLASLGGCGPQFPCAPLADEGPRGDRFPDLASDEEALLFLGDILLAERVTSVLVRCGDDWPFSALAPAIESASAVAVIGNHEGPLTESVDAHEPNDDWNYGADPETAAVLAGEGFTHLSLANNHAFDRGLGGLEDSWEALEAAHIVPFGAGSSEAQAAGAPRVEVAGQEVALLGAMHPYSHYVAEGWTADGEDGGLLMLEEEHFPPAAAGAASADLVVLFPHWGQNYAPVVESQREDAELAQAEGVDLIIGHHSHNAQSFGFVEDMPVLWSLGNAAFGTGGRFGADVPGYGLIARVVLGPEGLRRAELMPIRVNNQLVNYRAEPCPLAEGEEVLQELAALEGSELEIVDGLGVFSLQAPPAP